MVSEARIGSVGKGIGAALLATILYIGIPYALLYLFENYIDLGAGSDITGLKDVLTLSIEVGIVLVIIAFPGGFYEKGNRHYAYWHMLDVVFGVVWIWIILHGGEVDDFISMEVEGIGIVSIDLAVKGLLVLFIAFKLLKALVIYLDNRDHRDDFLEKYEGLLDGTYANKREWRAARKGKIKDRKKSEKDGSD